jgi:hypothetical protein
MRFKQLMVASIMLSSSGLALAGPVVPSWDFETTTGFDDDGAWTCQGGAPGDNTCDLTFSNLNADGSDYETLSWGTPAESNTDDAQSYLDITNLIGSIITGGGWFDINYFDHYNHIITTAGGNMETVNINGLFEITSPIGFGIPGTNGVLFDETVNFDAEDCPGPNPNDSACDDIFVTGVLQSTIGFWYDGRQYFLSFRFLAGEGTTVVDNGDGTVTIFTTEACSTDGQAGCGEGEPYTPGISRLITQARIDVPAPESLALFGLGLLLFGLHRPRSN